MSETSNGASEKAMKEKIKALEKKLKVTEADLDIFRVDANRFRLLEKVSRNGAIITFTGRVNWANLLEDGGVKKPALMQQYLRVRYLLKKQANATNGDHDEATQTGVPDADFEHGDVNVAVHPVGNRSVNVSITEDAINVMITNSKKSANIDIMKAKSTGSTDADMVDTQLDAVGAQPGDAGVQASASVGLKRKIPDEEDNDGHHEDEDETEDEEDDDPEPFNSSDAVARKKVKKN